MKPRDRLALSEKVITGWEAISPAGRLADTNRMLRDEMVILQGVADEEPALREKAEALIARYQQLALRMKLVH